MDSAATESLAAGAALRLSGPALGSAGSPARGRRGAADLTGTGEGRSRAACQHHTSDDDRLWEATVEEDSGRRWLGGEAALGGLLLLLGTLVLVGQALELDLGRVGWPFFVIVPGLGLLGLGLAGAGRLGEVLAMAGGVVTMAGLVLLVQNTTDRFETWAYAWTLVVLVGVGIGRWLVGVTRGRRDLAAGGGWLIAAGLAALPGLRGVLRGRHRVRRPRLRRGRPLRPGGRADPGRPGPARPPAAGRQASVRSRLP